MKTENTTAHPPKSAAASKSVKKKPAKKKERKPAIVLKNKTYSLFYAWLKIYNQDKDLRNEVRCGKLATALALLQDYLKAANKFKLAEGKFLETSPALIANSINQSPRSVFNHFEFLESIGVIAERRYGDFGGNTQLALNPSLIAFIKRNSALVEESKDCLENAPVSLYGKRKKTVDKSVDNPLKHDKSPPNFFKKNSSEMAHF